MNNNPSGIIEIAQTLFYSLRLDLSTASYVIGLPFLLSILFQFTGKQIFKRIINAYHLVIIPVCVLLLVGNIKVYESWGTVINRRAIAFIADPKEVMASLSGFQLIFYIALFVLFSALLIAMFKRFVLNVLDFVEKKYLQKTVYFFVTSLLIFLGIRGGIQLIPINESAAYFSSKTVLNHASLNPIWYLANNLSKSSISDHNPFEQMSEAASMDIFSKLYPAYENNSIEVINPATKPNIVLILLESWTADIIAQLDGDKGSTPFFSSLCDSGLLFTNIYATGRRTDQAFPSILSGFPAQPDHSIIRFTDKTEQLPYLTTYFKQNGYDLSYFYGGELGFANMHSFLLYGGFDKFVSKDDFQTDQINSKWGAHDEFVFSKHLNDLDKMKQPFFSMLVTLSSHEPFEIPRPDFIKGDDTPSKFRNAVRYTDECLKEYFFKASKQPWFNNTFFILVADHGHLQPRERDYYDIKTHHIPLLFYGPVLSKAYRGKQISATGNQNDLAATLLHQFHADATKFNWSNDLLNPGRINFAYTDFDESLGWINDKGSFIYNSTTRKTDKIVGNIPDSFALTQAVAYRQRLYKEFLEMGNK